MSMAYLIQIDDQNKIVDEDDAKDLLGKASVLESIALYRLTSVGKVEKLCVVRSFKECANEGGYVTDLFNNFLFNFNGR